MAPLAYLALALVMQSKPAAAPAWSGEGQMRVLVRVPTQRQAPNAEARVDERPADVRIDFQKLLGEANANKIPNIASVQVIRHDPATGPNPLSKALMLSGAGSSISLFAGTTRRFLTSSPKLQANLATSGGKLPVTKQTRSGYFYECVGDARDGRMAFIHRDDGHDALYAIYFDLAPADKLPDQQPPRGFVGDGLNRCEPIGHSTTGLIHGRIDLADLNGDELPDLLVGLRARHGCLVSERRRARRLEIRMREAPQRAR